MGERGEVGEAKWQGERSRAALGDLIRDGWPARVFLDREREGTCQGLGERGGAQ